jgi:hypothetical protein
MRTQLPPGRILAVLITIDVLLALTFRPWTARGRQPAEDVVPTPTVERAASFDVSPPLRDLAADPAAVKMASSWSRVGARDSEEGVRVGDGLASPTSVSPLSGATSVLPLPPSGPNPFVLLQSFEGISTADLSAGLRVADPFPADATGAVGPNHYVQAVNFAYAVYNRSGQRILGPLPTGIFWSGMAGACGTGIWSDVVVLYDRQADRWFVSRFARNLSTPSDWYQCFAISQTPDPTGAYFRYAWRISTAEFNDYPKFGIWPDGYYMTALRDKIFPGKGMFVAAFERSKMLVGDPQSNGVVFIVNNTDISNAPRPAGMLPADWDGQTPPPAGAPNYLIRPTSTRLGWPSDSLEVWELRANWNSPLSSTLNLTTRIPVDPYQPACQTSPISVIQNCIPQPNTTNRLDPLSFGNIMYRLAYRNFGDHEAMVLNHTVDVGDFFPVHAGIRWYELRRSSGTPWAIYQQAVHAPDAHHRWVGSIAMDRAGDIVLGYSTSSSTRYPSIAFASRRPSDPLGTLSNETVIQSGSGAQTGFLFWSDWSQLTLDPRDDCTFWYVNSYQPFTSAAQSWNTRIAALGTATSTCPGTSDPVMSIDGPANGGVITGPFTASGFAIDKGAASGTGVTQVHVWATPNGGSPMFLGVATYGAARPDVGSIFGGRFTNSGWSLGGISLAPGTYTLTAYAFSTVTNSFSIARSVTITAVLPQSNPLMSVDAPTPNSTVGQTFTIAGWAIDRAATSGVGTDAVHAWVFPTSGAPARFVGSAGRTSRPDVAAAFGAQFLQSGYSLNVTAGAVPPDTYLLVVYARSTVTGTFNKYVALNITVSATVSNPALFVDRPAPGSTIGGVITISGWALDRGAASGPGVNDIHIWALPTSGAPGTLLGAGAYGLSRPDVGALFGAQFTNSGYTLTVDIGSVPPGSYNIVVFARSTVTGTFSFARAVPVTILAP